MRKFITVLTTAAFLAAAAGVSIAANARKSPGKSRTASKSAAKSAKRKSAGHNRSASKRSPQKRRKAASSETWRNRQSAPTPERYREIQEALAKKGYLKSEPTGTWDQGSIDALRRFQQDQNIEASGKIDSLSLIALGLGPQYNSASASAQPKSAQP